MLRVMNTDRNNVRNIGTVNGQRRQVSHLRRETNRLSKRHATQATSLRSRRRGNRDLTSVTGQGHGHMSSVKRRRAHSPTHRRGLRQIITLGTGRRSITHTRRHYLRRNRATGRRMTTRMSLIRTRKSWLVSRFIIGQRLRRNHRRSQTSPRQRGHMRQHRNQTMITSQVSQLTVRHSKAKGQRNRALKVVTGRHLSHNRVIQRGNTIRLILGNASLVKHFARLVKDLISRLYDLKRTLYRQAKYINRTICNTVRVTQSTVRQIRST